MLLVLDVSNGGGRCVPAMGQRHVLMKLVVEKFVFRVVRNTHDPMLRDRGEVDGI